MRQGYTHIAIVLDRSGSMSSIRDDTIGGINAFIAEQKRVPGSATLSLALFDNEYMLLHERANISTVEPLTHHTYQPRGTTALLDAIGRTIDSVGLWLSTLEEDKRPEKVVFVIVTDGLENSSTSFTIDQINKRIEHQRSVYNWQFVFLGANQDAITSAAKIGIGAGSTMTYAANDIGTRSAFKSASANMSSYRSAHADSYVFTADDRDKQTQAGVDASLNAVGTQR